MLFKRVKRQLKVTLAGRWYLGLTIVLGVVAVSSGNNILYLLESFLLGGLLLSGVVSERALKHIEVRWYRRACVANELASDRVEVFNHGKMPLFCVEVGEWKEKQFHHLGFIPFLGPGKKVSLKTSQKYPKRGIHRWEGVACATRYPFGFAQKIRWWEQPGSRLIWPEGAPRASLRKAGEVSGGKTKRLASSQTTGDRISLNRGPQGVGNFTEGEVRNWEYGDDYRYVVWTLSAIREDPVVRVRRREKSDLEVVLDLRTEPGEGFELKVRQTAQTLYTESETESRSLVLIGHRGRRHYQGQVRSLDVLAEIQAEGRKEVA